ncbi:hypothetical protein DRN73_08555 [Candidatus Pacearchaeota archaeon]|nr:MAG: hypothetical protein DRN73_08555 [Candidatus Pacearchaeota archaeon]
METIFLLIISSKIFFLKVDTLIGNRVVKDSIILGYFNHVKLKDTSEKEIYDKFKKISFEILDLYENLGFPFAVITFENFKFKGDTLLFDIKINEGRLAYVEDIKVKGNKKTKFWVFKKIFKTPVIYTKKWFRNSELYLRHLNICKIESVDFFVDKSNRIFFRLWLNEFSNDYFNASVGYGGGELRGFLNLESFNLFGTARHLSVRWERIDKNHQILNFEFLEPWVLGIKFDLWFNGYFEYVLDNYLWRGGNVGVNYLILPWEVGLGGGVGWENNFVEKTKKKIKKILFNVSYNEENFKMELIFEKSIYFTKFFSRVYRDFNIYRNFGFDGSLNLFKITGDYGEYELLKFGGYETFRAFLPQTFLLDFCFWANSFIYYKFLKNGRIYILNEFAFFNDQILWGKGVGLKFKYFDLCFAFLKKIYEGKVHISMAYNF